MLLVALRAALPVVSENSFECFFAKFFYSSYVIVPGHWPTQILYQFSRLTEWEVDSCNPWPIAEQKLVKRLAGCQWKDSFQPKAIGLEGAFGDGDWLPCPRCTREIDAVDLHKFEGKPQCAQP
jgi:hypothetical protein